MRAKEFLTELWTRPYDLTIDNQYGRRIQYLFTTSDGRPGKINFDDTNILEYSGVVIHFYIDGYHGTSGRGDAIAIFSTVIAACRDWFSRHSPDFVVFESDDQKKLQLYARIADALLKRYQQFSNWTTSEFSDAIWDVSGEGVEEDMLVYVKRSIKLNEFQDTSGGGDEDPEVLYLNEFADIIEQYLGRGYTRRDREQDRQVSVKFEPKDRSRNGAILYSFVSPTRGEYSTVNVILLDYEQGFGRGRKGPSGELKTVRNAHRIADLIFNAQLNELNEYGSIHNNMRRDLERKGYEYISSGIDKNVFREPGTGEIYIVFGYRPGVKGFSPDQLMFRDWINYCNQHRGNPHLPRFSGLESFKYRGETYLQARMEPLQEIPEKVRHLLGYLEDVAFSGPNMMQAIRNLTKKGYYDEEENEIIMYQVRQIVEYLGGPQAAYSLMRTVQAVMQFGKQHGFPTDLHSGNYMQRPDGTIVVNDPYVLWIKDK